MDPNSNEVSLLIMIDNLEKRIKLLQKKNDEMKKILDVLFKIEKEKEIDNGIM